MTIGFTLKNKKTLAKSLVELSKSSDAKEWTLMHVGTLLFQKVYTKRRTFFFRLFTNMTGDAVWEHELRSPFHYKQSSDEFYYFHDDNGDDKDAVATYFGLKFSDKHHAQKLFACVDEYDNHNLDMEMNNDGSMMSVLNESVGVVAKGVLNANKEMWDKAKEAVAHVAQRRRSSGASSASSGVSVCESSSTLAPGVSEAKCATLCQHKQEQRTHATGAENNAALEVDQALIMAIVKTLQKLQLEEAWSNNNNTNNQNSAPSSSASTASSLGQQKDEPEKQPVEPVAQSASASTNVATSNGHEQDKAAVRNSTNDDDGNDKTETKVSDGGETNGRTDSTSNE